jgi:hypothetical protein
MLGTVIHAPANVGLNVDNKGYDDFPVWCLFCAQKVSCWFVKILGIQLRKWCDESLRSVSFSYLVCQLVSHFEVQYQHWDGIE